MDTEVRQKAVNICHSYFDDYFQIINLSLKRKRSQKEAASKVDKILNQAFAERDNPDIVAITDQEIEKILAEIELEII